MPVTELHSGDFGTVFNIQLLDNNLPVDVSNADYLGLNFRKPGYPPQQYTRTPSLASDGTDGKLVYKSVSGEIDTLGTWQIQGYVVTQSGAWYSDIATFRVRPNVS